MHNYDAIDAYQRWEGQLEDFIAEIRSRFDDQKPFPGLSDFMEDSEVSRLDRWKALRQGKIVWGVFARSFWPIYMKGMYSHYGTILCGTSPASLDRGAFLFELSESLRQLRDYGGEAEESHPEFVEAIRDDHRMDSRLPVPKELSGGRDIFFQSICIHRPRLPAGYLHHRLVPVITHEQIPFASILPKRYWGDKFCSIWQSGDKLLDDETMLEYRKEYPDIIP